MWDGPASQFLTSVWLSREIKIYMHLFFEWHGTSGPFRILNFRLGGLFDALWAQTYAKNSEKSWLDWLEVYRLLIWPPFWPRCRGCCSQPVWSLWPLVTLVAQLVAQLMPQGWLFCPLFGLFLARETHPQAFLVRRVYVLSAEVRSLPVRPWPLSRPRPQALPISS